MARAGEGEERESSIASGWTVQADSGADEHAVLDAVVAGGPSDDAAVDQHALDGEADEAADEPQLSNAALVLLGVFGGLYLIYAWVWLSWAQFYSTQNAMLADASGSLGSGLQQVVFWIAPLAPILWFLSVLLMHWRAGIRRLILWIGIGAVVLVPLPFFTGGGGA